MTQAGWATMDSDLTWTTHKGLTVAGSLGSAKMGWECGWQ
jgi:hypothetical protein